MDSIKRFAKEVLGCGCPEEVFKDIEYEQKIGRLNGACHVDRILIGRRLLIYIFRPDQHPQWKRLLPELIEEGKKERDQNVIIVFVWLWLRMSLNVAGWLSKYLRLFPGQMKKSTCM